MVPMRDGVRLFTSVYVPKDASQKYPILLTRTPYSVAPYGIDRYRDSLGPSEHFQKEGFVFVYQDARGRYMSEGEFLQVRPFVPGKKNSKDIDESTDTYDSIEWAAEEHPEPQRAGGDGRRVAARLPRCCQHDRFPSGAEGGFPSGADGGLLHGRRRVP
jgi:hypothetical protein